MADDIRDFLKSYAKTYDAFNVKQMATFACCPLVTVYEGQPTVHTKAEDLERFFSELLVWFRGIDHGVASISDLEVRRLGEFSAFAQVVWRSTRADGEGYIEWPTAYQLVRQQGNWKILAIVLRYESPVETANE